MVQNTACPSTAVTSNADGRYLLRGLAPNAKYVLRVRPPNDSADLLANWYDRKQFADDAMVVELPLTGLTIDLVLEEGAQIMGQVRGTGNGPPIAGAEVQVAWVSDDNSASCSLAATNCRPFYADAKGMYALPALYSGKYLLSFYPDLDDVYVESENAFSLTVDRAAKYVDIDGIVPKGGTIRDVSSILRAIRFPASSSRSLSQTGT